MNWGKFTTYLLIATGAIWALYDLIPAFAKAKGDTISEVLKNGAYRLWMIPLYFGVLGGHFFWNRQSYMGDTKYYILGCFVLITIGLNIWSIKVGYTPTRFIVSILPVIGYVIGHLIWTQNK